MNYRLITDGTIRIETTHDAATPGGNVYGTLRLARAHLDAWITLRMEVRNEWLHKPERDLPSHEPAAVPAQQQAEQKQDVAPTPADSVIIDAGGVRS